VPVTIPSARRRKVWLGYAGFVLLSLSSFLAECSVGFSTSLLMSRVQDMVWVRSRILSWRPGAPHRKFDGVQQRQHLTPTLSGWYIFISILVFIDGIELWSVGTSASISKSKTLANNGPPAPTLRKRHQHRKPVGIFAFVSILSLVNGRIRRRGMCVEWQIQHTHHQLCSSIHALGSIPTSPKAPPSRASSSSSVASDSSASAPPS